MSTQEEWRKQVQETQNEEKQKLSMKYKYWMLELLPAKTEKDDNWLFLVVADHMTEGGSKQIWNETVCRHNSE